MALSTLSVFAIIRLYLRHLRGDFPLAERRPLLSMLRLRKKGLYQVFGLVENGKLVGYGATAGQENEPLLLDYLAVCQGERGKGVGSRMLSLLCGQMKNMLLAEVESPLITADPNEPQMRWRRIRFYERNGFSDTGIRCRLFGVDYWILAFQPTKDPVRDLEKIYRQLFPPLVFEKQIQILPPSDKA